MANQLTIDVIDNVNNEWDSFVEESNNGTIFHKTKFLSYHLNNSFDQYHLLDNKDCDHQDMFASLQTNDKNQN